MKTHRWLAQQTRRIGLAALFGGAMLCASVSAIAADWSDTSIGYRFGTKFREPFNPDDIDKNIFDLQHVSGYKYGINFFNVDFLVSNSSDPSTPGGSGAQEAYLVYRNTVDLSKVTGTEYKYGIVRGIGATFGFDWNTKNDFGYGSKKRMPLLGPTVMFDVPGFLNLSLLELWESNAPVGHPTRYYYRTHPMLTAAWGIPIGDLPLSFEGFMNVIAPKGHDEFGGQTKTETNFDGELMADVGRITGGPKGVFKVGFEYQYWKNKFGNDSSGPAGGGAFAKTPMIRAEYHF
jgi:hypothetical protein